MKPPWGRRSRGCFDRSKLHKGRQYSTSDRHVALISVSEIFQRLGLRLPNHIHPEAQLGAFDVSRLLHPQVSIVRPIQETQQLFLRDKRSRGFPVRFQNLQVLPFRV